MEKDLFQPIKAYFEQYGYLCDGEVRDIDLYMEKNGQSIAIELKTTLDLKAITQAALRQKITDYVFVGIFQPKNRRSKAFQNKLYLLKRLGIGLLAVSKRTGIVEIISEPVVSELSAYQVRNRQKKEELKEEFRHRKSKSNTGGVNRTKLITGYREDALLVLDAIMKLGSTASVKQIKETSHVAKAASILYDNHYGWFEHPQRGIYGVSAAGIQALSQYGDVLQQLRQGSNFPG